MEGNKKKIIGVIALVAVVCAVLFWTGAIHNALFAKVGSTYGPGTYVIGTDLPPGTYDFEGKYDIQGEAIFKASSNGGLSLSNNGVELMSGTNVTIYEGGSMTYKG